jgi:uncharacterized protein YgbK (DUF1537 family)
MNGVRILADDLTGALDAAAAFAGAVPVFIDRPPAEVSAFATAPVAVVATPTRDVPSAALPELLQPVLGWLKAGDLAFKKVDSLLRGNTFAEVAWIARAGGFTLTVFAPAFPAQGRVTGDGRQWLVAAGAAARQAVGLSFAEAFGQFGLRAGSASPADDPAVDVWTPDVSSDTDLDAVAAQAARDAANSPNSPNSRLWCGSAGLAQALARRRGLAASAQGAAAPLAGAGPTVLVSASHQRVLREQWQRLRDAENVQALAEHANAAELARALDQVRDGAGDAWFDLSPAARIAAADAAQLLAAQTAQLVAGLPRPGQLIVAGGDTLLALCRAAGVEALLTQPAVRHGWGCARLQGGAWDGVPCHSRSGAFGGPDDLLAMIRLLKGSDNS